MKRIALATVLTALAALAPSASAQEAPGPDPALNEAQAIVELNEAEQALATTDPHAADPTEEIRDLAAALPYLEGAERRRARAVLARPPADEGGVEPFGGEWSQPEAANSPVCDTRFCVHWVDGGADAPDLTDTTPANGVPDYVELVLMRAQESFQVQNTDLGWPLPKSDGAKGQGPSGQSSAGLTDIYLSEICSSSVCVFGYAGPDDSSSQCSGPPFQCAAFLVLDNDYEEFGYPDPDIPLSVTMAHEYNHVLQFAIDALQDAWMFESTATWSEEKVFPDADDWLAYMPPWARNPQQPLTRFSAGGGLRVYGSAVWNHWLDQGAAFGPDVVLDSWEKSHESDPRHFGVGAYQLGIREHGGMGFAQEFSRFAAATAEWRVTDGNFPDEVALPDVARRGKLRPGGRARKFKLDHTSYRLLRVKPGSAGTIRLRLRVRRGVRTGVALVGRDGPALGGAITEELTYLPRGGRASIALTGAQEFERITAVVANADGRVRGFGAGDWSYSRDNERFRIALGGS